MRRIVVTSIAAAAVVALPCAAHAAVSKADQKATRIVVKVTDAKGDVVAKSGTMNDLAGDGDGSDPFKPGHGTAYTPTAADEAVDLTKVAYKIVRVGRTPALTITYTAVGPFSHSSKITGGETAFEDKETADGVETHLGKGVAVQTMNDVKGDTHLFNGSRPVKCKGMTGTMATGSGVATQTVPLSCLATAKVKQAVLSSDSMHLTEDIVMTDSTSADGTETTTTKSTITAATDKAGKTRILPLTVATQK